MTITPSLALAQHQFAIAATTWSVASLSRMLLLGGDDSEHIDESYIEMRCAAAVLEWELLHHASAAEQLDADYDDDTIDELLRGVQG
ncbi:hypothetical protein B1R94_26050 [Mycolicibacterium litorale]|nr:hypothetical protein B1R94_26050 [Mycolicibacterium litorale]